MKLFADTADMEDIIYSFQRGVNSGITTNPKILESTGDLSEGLENACKRILREYPDAPVSLETDLGGIETVEELLSTPYLEIRDRIVSQGRRLASWGENVYVKIPFCEGGIQATRILSDEGVKTNVTATMDSAQALEAANAGATVTNIFVNRRLDYEVLRLAGYKVSMVLSDPSQWKEIVSENKERFNGEAWEIVLRDMSYAAKQLDRNGTDLIGASIRDPTDVHRMAKAGPQIITIPTPILRKLGDIKGLRETKRSVSYVAPVGADIPIYRNPMTLKTILDFENAANTYRT